MSAVMFARRRSSDMNKWNGDKLMWILKSGFKFLIFVPFVCIVLFMYKYWNIEDITGKCFLSSSPPSEPSTTSIHLPPNHGQPIPTSVEGKSSIPPLTIHTNQGRIGNQMLTFATLLGLGTLNGREIAIMPENHYILSKYFRIDYPVVEDETFVKSDPWPIVNWLRDEDRHINQTTNIVTGTIFPSSFTFFHHCREKLKEAFQFHPVVNRYVRRMMDQVKEQLPWVEVFVGVHVRRGDYIKTTNGGWLRAFNGREVDAPFFQKAVQHFQDKYENIVFLAVSDDREWCKENLPPLGINVVPNSPSEEYDLAFLAACNHTIMTYGTYGFWGGYLGGGEVVYFTDFLQPDAQQVKDYFLYDKMYPEEWVGISTTPPGYWDNYVNPFYLEEE